MWFLISSFSLSYYVTILLDQVYHASSTLSPHADHSSNHIYSVGYNVADEVSDRKS